MDANQQQEQAPQEPQQEPQQARRQPPSGVLGLVVSKPSGLLLFLARVMSLWVFVMYVVNPRSAVGSYRMVLKLGTAASVIRLYQRLHTVRPSLSLEFVRSVLLEDSTHYIFYTLILLNLPPTLLFMAPIVIFSFFHATIFLRELLTATNISFLARLSPLIARVDFYATSGFILAAKAELGIAFALVISMITSGNLAYGVAFAMYLPFLTLRYLSRRNPHFRTVFGQASQFIESAIRSPSCPGIIVKIYDGIRNVILQLHDRMRQAVAPQQ